MKSKFKLSNFIGILFLLNLHNLVAQPLQIAQSFPNYQDKILIQSASELDYPPFSIVTPDGKADGFSVELMRAALKTMGKEVDFKVDKWDTIKDELANGKLDTLPVVGRTPEREILYDFTNPYLQHFGALITRDDNIAIKNIHDVKGKALITMKGDNAEEFARRNNLTDPIITTSSFEDALKLLSSGKGDVVLVQQIVGKQLMKKLNLPNLKMLNEPVASFRQDYCFAVNSDNKELLAILNEGLANTRANGTYTQLYNKWFDIPTKYTKEYLIWVAIGMFFSALMVIGAIILVLYYRRLIYSKSQLERKVLESIAAIEEKDKRLNTSLVEKNYLYEILQTISTINHLLISDKSIEQMLKESCDILAHYEGGYSLAWIGLLKNEHIEIVAHSADIRGYVSSLNLSINPSDPTSKGPSAQSILKNQTIITKSFDADYYAIWRERATKAGLGSSICVPLRTSINEKPFGSMAIYSERKSGFLEDEITMIENLAGDISYAISSRHMELERKQLEDENYLTNVKLEIAMNSMSDAIFISDVEGNFLHFNEAFATFHKFKNIQECAKTLKEYPLFLNVYSMEGELLPLERWAVPSALRGEAGIDREFTLQRKDTGERWIGSYNFAPIRNKEGVIIGSVVTGRDITQKKKAEEELKNEVLYRTKLMENAHDGIAIINQNFEVIEANQRFVDMIGYTKDELYKLHVWDFNISFSEAEIRKRFSDLSNTSLLFETQHRRKDGSVYDAEVSLGGVVIDEMSFNFVAVRDITKRKQAEAALIENEEKYRSLFEDARDMIHIIDMSGTIIDANAIELNTLGYSREEFIGKKLIEFIAPQYHERTKSILANVLQGKNVQRYETALITHDGREVAVEVSISPHYQNNKIVSLRAILHDLTEHNLQQKEAEHANQLELANKNLKELDRMKSMFIASMSHELRTPLNSIIGFSGMIVSDMAGPISLQQRDYLQRVYRAGKHLLTLITDVIDISKIEAGKIAVSYETFNLNEVINEAVQSVEVTLHEKGLLLKSDIPEDIEMYSDRKRLMQCLLNLLSNAIKYSEHGSIELIVKRLDTHLQISLSDTGIGIAPKDMSKLFQAFVRLESPLKLLNTGTGLGLYLTKKLTQEVLGGTISATSILGQGSTFILDIPIIIDTIVEEKE